MNCRFLPKFFKPNPKSFEDEEGLAKEIRRLNFEGLPPTLFWAAFCSGRYLFLKALNSAIRDLHSAIEMGQLFLGET
jgi:hypothetical protein